MVSPLPPLPLSPIPPSLPTPPLSPTPPPPPLSPTPGLNLLTNKVRGMVSGEVVSWSLSQKRRFGIHLLRKALEVYCIDTPHQIYLHEL